MYDYKTTGAALDTKFIEWCRVGMVIIVVRSLERLHSHWWYDSQTHFCINIDILEAELFDKLFPDRKTSKKASIVHLAKFHIKKYNKNWYVLEVASCNSYQYGTFLEV